MQQQKSVLFLTLKTFSLAGGIENVCKSIAYHFYQQQLAGLVNFSMISLYDVVPDEKYISADLFKGYAGRRISGFSASVVKGIGQDVVIMSHINLAPIGLLIKLVRPKTKLVLWTHGIEVWRPINRIKNLFLKKVDLLVAVSRYTADSLSTWHGVDQEKVKVIPNALGPFYEFPELKDTAKSIAANYHLQEGIPIFMALTRLKASERNKNYDLVIEALAELKKEGYLSYYFLCGKYEESEFQRLIQLASTLGYSNELIMPGYLEDEDVIKIQMAANAFVLPSSKEGFGLAFIEAQAAGLRVLAGNQDGSGEAVSNQLAGRLISPNDLDNLRNILKEWMVHPAPIIAQEQIQTNCKNNFNYTVFSQRLTQL